jgi:hypothetical protein
MVTVSNTYSKYGRKGVAGTTGTPPVKINVYDENITVRLFSPNVVKYSPKRIGPGVVGCTGETINVREPFSVLHTPWGDTRPVHGPRETAFVRTSS